MKVTAILFFAAALGSASPVGTRSHSMQARAGQCDCSKPFRAGNRFDDACPAGYKDISRNFFTISCVQAGCSEDEFEAQCNAGEPASAPPAVVEQPTGKTPAAPPGAQSACDCSKSFFAKADPVDNTCPAAYKDISKSSFSVSCAQVGCSKGDFEAQCGVRP